MTEVGWLDCPAELHLARVASLISSFWREVIEDEPDLPAAELAAELSGTADDCRRASLVVATDGADLVGAAVLVLNDIKGRDRSGWVPYLVVDPDRRGRGIGAELLKAVAERARAAGRARLDTLVPVSWTPGETFAQAVGAETGLVVLQNRLLTTEMDSALLQMWVDRAAERSSEYSLVAFDGLCPEELLESFARVIQVMNSAPRGAQTDDVVINGSQIWANETAHLERGGWGWTICARHDPSGELVGYTELGGMNHRPWLAIQGDTGVDAKHRNRGLGRWLKAVNALRLLHDRPEVRYVDSRNAGMNVPMLSINSAMGFRTVAEWQEWSLQL